MFLGCVTVAALGFSEVLTTSAVGRFMPTSLFAFFSHLHMVLPTEGNMLDINWLQAAKELVKYLALWVPRVILEESYCLLKTAKFLKLSQSHFYVAQNIFNTSGSEVWRVLQEARLATTAGTALPRVNVRFSIGSTLSHAFFNHHPDNFDQSKQIDW